MHNLPRFIAGLFAFITVQFLIKQLVVLNFNILMGPTVEQFWRHAKAFAHGEHQPRSPLKCKDCQTVFTNLPD